MITDSWRGFASDNYAGVHPAVLRAMDESNVGHQPAYGDDEVTSIATDLVKDLFGSHAEFYPVFNGTGANVVALQSLTERWQAVICAESSHVHADEGGAPEKMAGLKLWTVPTPDGKLTPDSVASQCFDMDFVHRAQPGAVSIAQSTELGTVYSAKEVSALAECAHRFGTGLHMDGARLANATVSNGQSVRSFTSDAGVDVVCFGGTKNGAMLAEAVVVLQPDRVRGVDFLRKTSMQLSSKMRFLSAQFVALLTDDLWLSNARHANAMAQTLVHGVRDLPGVHITQDVQANAVFVVLPKDLTARLQEQFRFYTWNQETGEVRWMCSWDTTEEDVANFVTTIRREIYPSA